MNSMLKKIKKLLTDPAARFLFLSNLGFYDHVSDEKFLKKRYRYLMGKELDLQNPKTFNEKLQWLKLHDRNPKYTILADKYAAKDYVASLIGDEHIIPLLGVWDNFDDIDFEKLPNEFVLKCTHDSGGLAICTDKSHFDYLDAKERIERSLKTNYYRYSREWPYKDIPHRIIAEEYMVDNSGYELKDYKFFCFDGEPKVMFIASDRQVAGEETKFDFFDMNFNYLPIVNGHPNSNKEINCPQTFEEMKKLAAILSQGIPQVRVDFYEINGKVYFGEMTFSHWGGTMPFEPESWDYKLGEYIKLPEKPES